LQSDRVMELQWIISRYQSTVPFPSTLAVLDCVKEGFSAPEPKIGREQVLWERRLAEQAENERVESTEMERPISLIWSGSLLRSVERGTVGDPGTQALIVPRSAPLLSLLISLCSLPSHLIPSFCFQMLHLLSFKI